MLRNSMIRDAAPDSQISYPNLVAPDRKNWFLKQCANLAGEASKKQPPKRSRIHR